MQGASDTNSWYDCYRGLRNKLNLEGTEMGEITLVTDFFDIGRGQDKNEELREGQRQSILMSSDVGQEYRIN